METAAAALVVGIIVLDVWWVLTNLDSGRGVS